MKTVLKTAWKLLTIPSLIVGVWLIYLLALLLSGGAADGYLAFAVALCAAVFIWWRRARHGTRRIVIGSGVVMVLALAPLAYLLVPMASSALGLVSSDASVQ